MMQEKESGRILQCIGGIYTVATDSGTVSCKARGVFRKRGMTPYAGDFVTVFSGQNLRHHTLLHSEKTASSVRRWQT